MNPLLEREELDFIFDLYRPEQVYKSEAEKHENSHFKDQRKRSETEEKSLSHYLV